MMELLQESGIAFFRVAAVSASSVAVLAAVAAVTLQHLEKVE
jgi:anti-sigma-K factor RskA